MPLDEMNKKLGSDSLNYISISGMVEATGLPPRTVCMACFDGDYPIPIKSQTRIKYQKLMLEDDKTKTKKQKPKKKKKKDTKGKGKTS